MIQEEGTHTAPTRGHGKRPPVNKPRTPTKQIRMWQISPIRVTASHPLFAMEGRPVSKTTPVDTP